MMPMITADKRTDSRLRMNAAISKSKAMVVKDHRLTDTSPISIIAKLDFMVIRKVSDDQNFPLGQTAIQKGLPFGRNLSFYSLITRIVRRGGENISHYLVK